LGLAKPPSDMQDFIKRTTAGEGPSSELINKELSIKGIKVSLVPESASLMFEGDKFKLQASLKASAESQDTIPESTAGEFIE